MPVARTWQLAAEIAQMLGAEPSHESWAKVKAFFNNICRFTDFSCGDFKGFQRLKYVDAGLDKLNFEIQLLLIIDY